MPRRDRPNEDGTYVDVPARLGRSLAANRWELLMSLQLRNVIKTYREPDGNILTVLDIESFQIGRPSKSCSSGPAAAAKRRCST